MPNQRNKDKKFVGAWVKSALYRELKNAAKARGVNLTEWVTEHLAAAADDPNLVQRLADHTVAGALDVAGVNPAPGPTNYQSKPKAARRSKARRAARSVPKV